MMKQYNSRPVGNSNEHSICLIDGPNIDGVLGAILGRRPNPGERPCWDRVADFLRREFSPSMQLQFVLNKLTCGEHLYAFCRKLRHFGYKRILAKPGPLNPDPVDNYILQRLSCLRDERRRFRDVRVVLTSHDHCYAPLLREIRAAGGEVILMGFREELAPALLALVQKGCPFYDLQKDIEAFDCRLPRVI